MSFPITEISSLSVGQSIHSWNLIQFDKHFCIFEFHSDTPRSSFSDQQITEGHSRTWMVHARLSFVMTADKADKQCRPADVEDEREEGRKAMIQHD